MRKSGGSSLLPIWILVAVVHNPSNSSMVDFSGDQVAILDTWSSFLKFYNLVRTKDWKHLTAGYVKIWKLSNRNLYSCANSAAPWRLDVL